MLADLSFTGALILAFLLGTGTGRWLHQRELRSDRARTAARCLEEVAPMVRAWLESRPDVTVAETAVELHKYVRFQIDDVIDAVRVTLDRFVEDGTASRWLETGVLCGGFFVYRRANLCSDREVAP